MSDVTTSGGELTEVAKSPDFSCLDVSSTPEQMIAYARFVGQQLAPQDVDIVMPTRTILKEAYDAGLGPHYAMVARIIGISALQIRLGFVNTELLRSWSEQDWIDNGVWLSHMLGSPEEPVMPRQEDLQEASRVDIAPPVGLIYDRFKNLLEYQRALGFEPYEHPLDYESWTQEQYIENGRWMSQLLGSSDSPVMPTLPELRKASNLGLCPPPKAIVKRHGRSFENYQDKLGFVTSTTLERWSEQDWIDNGVWLVTSANPDTKKLTDEIIAQGRDLHISPTILQIEARFLGGLPEYQRRVNRALNGEIPLAEWSKPELLQHITDIVQQEGLNGFNRYMTSDPDANTVVELLGGREKSLSRLGIVDYSAWSIADVVAYGVRWARDHEGEPPTPEQIRELAEQGKGPSQAQTAQAKGAYYNYQECIQATYKEYDALFTELCGEDGSRVDVKIAHFVLRDFRPGERFARHVQNDMKAIKQLYYKNGRNMSRLIDSFSRSRSTIGWDLDDFVYFGQAAIGVGETVMEKTKVLTTLNKIGLTPFLDELSDKFGTLGGFVKRIRKLDELGSDNVTKA